MEILTILRFILQLVLFGLFLYIFGFPALVRYQEKKVIVVTSRQNTNGTQAPAVTIVVKRKDTRSGWKKQAWVGFVQTLCNDTNGAKTIVNCIEQQTYNLSEITARVTLGANVEVYSNAVKNLKWTEDFTHSYAGRTYTLNPAMKLKGFSFSGSTLKIGLKSTVNNGHYEMNY